MTYISAAVITFNEEKNIGRCLDSLAGVADEIVVLDSFSTDNTERICAEKGVRFVRHKFVGHIEQKNHAVALCRYPLILSLDADEALDEKLAESIRDLKEKDKPDADGYFFKRKTNYCGKWITHCGWYPDRKLRLWNRERGRWGGINPHDSVCLDSGAKPGHLDGDILHYSYYSIYGHIEQVNYFTDILAESYYSSGKEGNLLKILFNPVIKFVQSYFLKLGFLDGYYGFVICTISSHATFLKYVKLRSLRKAGNNSSEPHG